MKKLLTLTILLTTFIQADEEIYFKCIDNNLNKEYQLGIVKNKNVNNDKLKITWEGDKVTYKVNGTDLLSTYILFISRKDLSFEHRYFILNDDKKDRYDKHKFMVGSGICEIVQPDNVF